MEYINFSIAIPVSTYIELDRFARKRGADRNKILCEIIIGFFNTRSKGFRGKNNAGFYALYNKN